MKRTLLLLTLLLSFVGMRAQDMCTITLELTDSFGDGWNDAAIKIVNVSDDVEIGTYTNQNLDGSQTDPETTTCLVSVPNGKNLQFEWISGDFDKECSFRILDVNSDLLYEFEKNSSGPDAGVFYRCTVDGTKKPTNLTANKITSASANISWTGNDEAVSYNLRYTTVATDVVFYDGFENGMSNWTVIQNNSAANHVGWEQNNPISFKTDFVPHFRGNYVAISRSWDGDPYNADNWLITPQIPLGGTLKYWVCDDGTYHEHYDIYLSTTTNDIASFTKIYEPGDASATWTEVTVDLSTYSGENGYIAFRLTDYDKDYLLVDEVTITRDCQSDWATVNNIANPYYSLAGLTENTLYQVEVQCVYADGTSKWTTPYSFTTGVPITLTDNGSNTNLIATNRGKGADVTLSGRTFYKDGKWNTICLPFDLGDELASSGHAFDDTPLEGAKIMELANSGTGFDSATGTLSLYFVDADCIEAGHAYIIKWDTPGDPIVDPVFTGVTVINEDPSDQEVVSSDGNVTFKGTYDNITFDAENQSVLYMGDGNNLFYPTSGANIGACRAYFTLSDNASSQVKSYLLNFGDADDPTAIAEMVNVQSSMFKDAYFDLQGRKVKNPAKGSIYIHGGRKVVIK